VNVPRAVIDRTLEACEPGGEVVALGDNGSFMLMISNDLHELILDIFGCNPVSVHDGEGFGSLDSFSLLDILPQRFQKKGEASSKNDSL